MTAYDAAAVDRTLTDWSAWWSSQLTAVEDWDREGLTIAQRAWRLALNDPYATALLDCISGNVIGSGLHFVSAYQADADAGVTTPELDTRQTITAAVRAHTAETRLDPGCALTYVELIEQLVISGFVAGDGFAVRTWSPGRPGCQDYATAWRCVDAARVCNRDNKPNVDGRLVNGIELRNNVPYRLHVRGNDGKTWESVDWFAPDGSANVIHYAPDRRRAGAVRGFSKFAPILRLATLIARITSAHVTGKRIQASHPMNVKSGDPAKAAAAHRQQAQQGPNSAISEATVLFTTKDADVVFPNFSYQGSDFDAFIRTNLMSFCASWGYPWQFVLHQLTEGNLASAQAALDQADKTTTRYQDGVIAHICRPLVDSTLREAQARDRLGLPSSVPFARIAAGTWDRPRRADANRLRTRQAGELGRKLGVAPSTTLAEMGYNYEDEIRRTKADLAFAAAEGVVLATDVPPASPDPEPVPADPPPAAPDEPQTAQAEEDMRRADILALVQALKPAPAAPVQIVNRMEVDPASAAILGEAMGKAMPVPAAPIVNLPPTQLTVAPAPVHIQPAAPAQVVVQAADPAPVHVHVAAPDVRVDNQVVVPARPVKVTPQADGGVLMVPQG